MISLCTVKALVKTNILRYWGILYLYLVMIGGIVNLTDLSVNSDRLTEKSLILAFCQTSTRQKHETYHSDRSGQEEHFEVLWHSVSLFGDGWWHSTDILVSGDICPEKPIILVYDQTSI